MKNLRIYSVPYDSGNETGDGNLSVLFRFTFLNTITGFPQKFVFKFFTFIHSLCGIFMKQKKIITGILKYLYHLFHKENLDVVKGDSDTSDSLLASHKKTRSTPSAPLQASDASSDFDEEQIHKNNDLNESQVQSY